MAPNLRIVTTNAEIKRQVFEALRKKESTILNVARRAVKDFTRDSISEMMQSHHLRQIIDSEYIRGQMGVPDIGIRLRKFLRMWLKHLEPEIKWFASNGSFQMTFRLSPDVYDDLLSDEAATVVNEGRAGGEIEWLNWLLTAGKRKVVSGYRFLFYKKRQERDEETGRFKNSINQSIVKISRTRYGIMIPKSSWSVPSVIAGTKTDNIFTRVLDITIHKFQGFLEQRMEQYFGG